MVSKPRHFCFWECRKLGALAQGCVPPSQPPLAPQSLGQFWCSLAPLPPPHSSSLHCGAACGKRGPLTSRPVWPPLSQCPHAQRLLRYLTPPGAAGTPGTRGTRAACRHPSAVHTCTHVAHAAHTRAPYLTPSERTHLLTRNADVCPEHFLGQAPCVPRADTHVNTRRVAYGRHTPHPANTHTWERPR